MRTIRKDGNGQKSIGSQWHNRVQIRTLPNGSESNGERKRKVFKAQSVQRSRGVAAEGKGSTIAWFVSGLRLHEGMSRSAPSSAAIGELRDKCDPKTNDAMVALPVPPSPARRRDLSGGYRVACKPMLDYFSGPASFAAENPLVIRLILNNELLIGFQRVVKLKCDEIIRIG
jgi:hypothetical protein